MPPMRVLFFTQPGCLSCELMRMFLEAKEIVFEEHDISSDREARREIDPVRLDQFLDSAPSSDSVTES
jgi:arsenate reductase-like glutaredoxin family protein